MAADLTEKVVPLESVTTTLETMKLRQTVKAPNFQRTSVNGTLQRFKDRSTKKFTCKRFDTYFTIQRIR